MHAEDRIARARDTAAHLREVVAAIDRGEMTSTPTERAMLVGAITAFDSLDEDEPRSWPGTIDNSRT